MDGYDDDDDFNDDHQILTETEMKELNIKKRKLDQDEPADEDEETANEEEAAAAAATAEDDEANKEEGKSSSGEPLKTTVKKKKIDLDLSDQEDDNQDQSFDLSSDDDDDDDDDEDGNNEEADEEEEGVDENELDSNNPLAESGVKTKKRGEKTATGGEEKSNDKDRPMSNSNATLEAGQHASAAEMQQPTTSSKAAASSQHSDKRKKPVPESPAKELAKRKKQEQIEEENKKMQVLMANFSEEQLNRYELFRRSAFPKSSVKKIIQTVCGKPVSQSVVIAMSGIAKVFVGEIVEKALDVKQKWSETGPLQPKHLREAYRIFKNTNRLANSSKFKRPTIF